MPKYRCPTNQITLNHQTDWANPFAFCVLGESVRPMRNISRTHCRISNDHASQPKDRTGPRLFNSDRQLKQQSLDLAEMKAAELTEVQVKHNLQAQGRNSDNIEPVSLMID